MKRILALVSAAFALATVGAVARADDAATRGRAPDDRGAYEPDNTGRNARDRDTGAKTAGQQPNDRTDLRLTQEIRREVVKDDSLSTKAHNVKIITNDGVVTLRGPVDSAAEKARIQAKAEGVEGVKRVENELEVVSRR
jgi:hyperosmotically inducible periplasmic protein